MVVRNLPVVSIADAVVVVTATHSHTDQYNRLIYRASRSEDSMNYSEIIKDVMVIFAPVID